MVSEVIRLDAIKRDGGTQTRIGLNLETVNEYAEALRNGDDFPDIVVFYDGTDYWLADGFHRYQAHKDIGAIEINCEVRQGTRREAVLYSVGANATHGLRRTNADKRRAVETLLRDEEWAKWSDREIARRAGVSDKTVGTIRKELHPTAEFPQSRIGGDGRTIDTANIGKPIEITREMLDDVLRRIWVHEAKFEMGIDASYFTSPEAKKAISLAIGGQLIIQISDENILRYKLSKTGAARIEGDEVEQPEPSINPFKVNDRVSFQGRPGIVRYIKPETCGVYMDASHTTHHYRWQELERIEEQPAARPSLPTPEQESYRRLTLQHAHRVPDSASGWMSKSSYSYQGTVDILIAEGLLEQQEANVPGGWVVRITAQGCDAIGKGAPDWMKREVAQELAAFANGESIADQQSVEVFEIPVQIEEPEVEELPVQIEEPEVEELPVQIDPPTIHQVMLSIPRGSEYMTYALSAISQLSRMAIESPDSPQWQVAMNYVLAWLNKIEEERQSYLQAVAS